MEKKEPETGRKRVDYRGPMMNLHWIQKAFFDSGGTIEWQESTELRACATFTHPETISVTRELTGESFAANRGYVGAKADKKQFLRNRLGASGVAEVFRSRIHKYWVIFTNLHEGKPNDDRAFDYFRAGKTVQMMPNGECRPIESTADLIDPVTGKTLGEL